MTARGTLDLAQGSGPVHVSNGIACIAVGATNAQGGYVTVDVPNPDNLTFISGSDVPPGFASPGAAITTNGSGVGLLIGTALTAPRRTAIDVMDTRDPSNTDDLITGYTLPGTPTAVSVASGIAYVATGAGGLQVVNYLSFDANRVAPTVSITGPAGTTVDEGSRVAVRTTANDDVQVRNVELLLNGVVVANDVSAPFELAATMPTLASGATEVKLQVRATDTGGNSTLSNELTYTLVADSTAPLLLATTPANGGAGFKVDKVTLRFSEAIDPAVVSPVGFTATNLGADNAVITDVAGNPLAAAISTTFTSISLDLANAVVWTSADSGDWNDPLNWSTGVVPGANDNVIIDVRNSNITVTLDSGSTTVRSLVMRDALVVTGASTTLTVLGQSATEGEFTLQNGATLVASGSQALFVANGATNIDGGSLTAATGGKIQMPTVTSYTHTSGAGRDEAVLRASGVGSVLDLRNVLSVTNGSGVNDRLLIDALAGGRVDLRAVQQITDAAVGDQRNRFVGVTAAGVNSVVDLTALAQVADGSGGSLTGENRWSQLTAQSLGRIVANSVQTFVTNVFVLTQALGTIQGNVVLGPGSIREDR